MARGSAERRRSSILGATIWMLLVTVLLLLVGVHGGLSMVVGGAVGGYLAGSAGRGIAAAAWPSALFAVVMGVAVATDASSIKGALAGLGLGLGMGAITLVLGLAFLAGAAIGGALARVRGPA